MSLCVIYSSCALPTSPPSSLLTTNHALPLASTRLLIKRQDGTRQRGNEPDRDGREATCSPETTTNLPSLPAPRSRSLFKGSSLQRFVVKVSRSLADRRWKEVGYDGEKWWSMKRAAAVQRYVWFKTRSRQFESQRVSEFNLQPSV